MTRAPRELSVEAELARALAGARDAAGVETEIEVDLDRLQDVESALAIRFEDDVLALFAAAVPSLGARLSAVVGTTGELRERGLSGELIGLGRLDEDLYLCVVKRKQADEGSELLVVDAIDGQRRSTSVLALVQERCEVQPGSSSFRGRLVRPPPESTKHGRRVRHKVFGEGRLLSEQGSGPKRKCKVDFEGKGLKLLQARFLEFDD